MPLQMDEDGHLVHVPTGQLANNNAAACGCCETPTCCVRDPAVTLYMTVDNYEIDLPVRSIYSPWGVDDSLCTTFPDEAELAAMGFDAIPTNNPGTSTWGWDYGVGPGNIPVPAPAVVIPGHGSTPIEQEFLINSILHCVDVGGVYRWRLSNPSFPGNYLFFKRSNPGTPYTWQRCYCYPRSDSGYFPDFGPVGTCDPISLEAVVECYFGRYTSFFSNNDGHCRTTGRVRLRITE